jgi:hypothetical protein
MLFAANYSLFSFFLKFPAIKVPRRRYNGGVRQSRDARLRSFHNQYIKVGFTLPRVGRVFFVVIVMGRAYSL